MTPPAPTLQENDTNMENGQRSKLHTSRPAAMVDLRTAVLLSSLYGITGGVAALLLLPLLAQKTEIKLPLTPPLFASVLALQLTVIYGLMGWAGLRLARARGLEPAPLLTALWRSQRPLPSFRGLPVAAATGLLCGASLIIAVRAITRAFPGTLPEMLHPPSFASALAASTAGSIGEEILCRLLLLSALYRLVPSGARWSVAASVGGSAIAFGALHTPGMVALYGGLGAVPAMAWVWVVGLNALIGVAFGYLYLRRGIGAAITGHWCCDLVWHVCSAIS